MWPSNRQCRMPKGFSRVCRLQHATCPTFPACMRLRRSGARACATHQLAGAKRALRGRRQRACRPCAGRGERAAAGVEASLNLCFARNCHSAPPGRFLFAQVLDSKGYATNLIATNPLNESASCYQNRSSGAKKPGGLQGLPGFRGPGSPAYFCRSVSVSRKGLSCPAASGLVAVQISTVSGPVARA